MPPNRMAGPDPPGSLLLPALLTTPLLPQIQRRKGAMPWGGLVWGREAPPSRCLLPSHWPRLGHMAALGGVWGRGSWPHSPPEGKESELGSRCRVACRECLSEGSPPPSPPGTGQTLLPGWPGSAGPCFGQVASGLDRLGWNPSCLPASPAGWRVTLPMAWGCWLQGAPVFCAQNSAWPLASPPVMRTAGWMFADQDEEVAVMHLGSSPHPFLVLVRKPCSGRLALPSRGSSF